MYCSLLRLLSNLVSTVQLTSTRLWQSGSYDTGTHYTLLAGNWASFKYDNISNFGTGIGFRRCVFPLNCIKIRQLYSQGPWLNVLVWTLSILYQNRTILLGFHKTTFEKGGKRSLRFLYENDKVSKFRTEISFRFHSIAFEQGINKTFNCTLKCK